MEIELPDGTILDAPDDADPSVVAKAYLARQGQPSQPAESRTARALRESKRVLGLNTRSIAEGAMGVVGPFADLAGHALNVPMKAYDKLAGNEQPSFRFQTNHSGQFSQDLTNAGLPTPETGIEKGANIATQLLAGGVAGSPMTSAVLGKMGLAAARGATVAAPQAAPAVTPAARTLQTAGVTLDRSQREGGRFLQMLRSAVTDHPATAGRQAEFGSSQLKSFTRAVLKSIGANSDEASQSVMLEAKKRIGSVFDGIGKNGTLFDDALQSEIATLVDDASRTVPESALSPLTRNIDDILNAVDRSGKINGEQFIKIRSHLSDLASTPDGGQVAQRLEGALLSSLERTYPGQRAALRNAADQWRSMRIIETAISKGADRVISPKILSNAMATSQNRAMSVYGQGGDQRLVSLAQAGRDIIPDALPNSGTVPRGLMQAPLRAIATAPLYRAGQNYLLQQPKVLPPGGGVRNALAPGMGATNALIQQFTR